MCIAVTADEEQSIEERELTKKLTRLNAEVAKANTELAEAVRLAAETESTAVEAELAAERAKEEAERIQEEIKLKAQLEEKRRQEEIKKMEEVRRMREEEERRAEEARRAKEAEWKRRDLAAEKSHAWEKWPIYEYKIGSDFGCIIRAPPSKFNESDVTCRLIDRLDCPLHFEQHEELVSNIIQIEPTYPDYKLQAAMLVAIPYVSQRSTAASREPVIKAFINGHWKEIETTDTIFDSHKDMKFAQIETPLLTSFAVFTRLKRDYVSVSKRGGKVTSSVDQRITITVPKDAINGKDLMLMEVQPVDTGSVNEIRLRTPACRGLLAASPIIRTSWESSEFQKPLTITIPCPPNPARAKKLAAMRKLKEEKMKNPPKVVIKLPHEEEKEKEEKRKKIEELRQAQKQQQGGQEPEGEVVEKKQARWYMGEYGNNDDDENDHLYLVSGSSSDRWTVIPEVKVIQVKLDLLQFDLDRPLDSFMVLRTRTNVEPDQVAPMAHQLTGFLTQKFAQVILKQRSDDPFDTVLQVVHVSKTDKTLKRLSEEGYDDGPEPSPAVAINEGDVIEVSFRGNVKSTQDEDNLKFVYNSNMESETEFQASEVDRYLQKNFPMFRGVVEVYKKYPVRNSKKLRRRDSTEDMDTTPVETKKELLCELPLTVPKYHVEPNKSPRRAPITIVNDRDPINEQLMRQLAEEMGDEWKTVAYLLNVSKARVQAIQRNVNVYDLPEEDARFDMLMTWLKKMPKATDKVTILSNAFLRCGRGDLAEEIRARDREFRQGQVSR
ncbi:hypothetical protein ACJMK2_025385 [Sinanodonta woodiana]|uniref:Death domain-containing protein n=2 Tax=Sinanodonta woodiana TaxID=1069815 RepID=A0ABD3XJX3_SINWO